LKSRALISEASAFDPLALAVLRQNCINDGQYDQQQDAPRHQCVDLGVWRGAGGQKDQTEHISGQANTKQRAQEAGIERRLSRTQAATKAGHQVHGVEE